MACVVRSTYAAPPYYYIYNNIQPVYPMPNNIQPVYPMPNNIQPVYPINQNIDAFLQVIVSFSNFRHYSYNNRDI